MDGFALAGRGHAGDACRCRFGSRRGPAERASSRARRWGSRRAASSRGSRCRHPARVCCRAMTTRSKFQESSPGANIRPAGGDLRRGAVVVEAGRRLGRLRWRRSRRRASPRLASRRGRGPPSSHRERAPPSGRAARARADLRGERRPHRGAARVGRGDGRAAEHGRGRRGRPSRRAGARGLEADVLVTSGGVSVGPHDLVRRIEAELGVEEVFWGVSVKPGKPISFGVARAAGSCSGCRGTRSRCSSASSCSSARPCSRSRALPPRPRFERGRLGGESSGTRRGTSSCAGASLRRRGVRRRAASRAGVAHDRAGGAGRCARAGAAGRGTALGRRSGRVPAPLAPRARAPLALLGARAPRGTRGPPAHERVPTPSRGRSPAAGYGA